MDDPKTSPQRVKKSTLMLAVIFFVGLLYSVYKLFSGHGGGGLYDFADAIRFSSIVLFFASSVVLLVGIRRWRDQQGAILFLFIGAPLTITVAIREIENYRYNLAPDLTPQYPLPLNERAYLDDIAGIKIALDSFVVTLKRNERKGAEIQSAYIDTVLYSQKGDQIFVSFVFKRDGERGAMLTSSAFYADHRFETYWNLSEASFSYSGDARDSAYLRMELRKFYFNQFRFADKDSLNENFFWKKMKSDVRTIIVD